MGTARRYDSGLLGDVKRTPQGGIRAPATLTRVGVFVYKMADGSRRRELRLPEEVFAPESLATLEAAPVTDLHPPTEVTADNWRELTIGHVVTPPQAAGPYVSSELAIQDAEAIRKVDAGERKELSCGYTCDLEDVAGEWQGEAFDAIQRRIRYNHVALGPPGWGRAGSNVALRLDHADGVSDEEGTDDMAIKVDGKEYTEADVRALLGERDTYRTKAETETKRADDAEAIVKAATDPKALHVKAQKRAKLLAAGATILGAREDGGAKQLGGKRWDEVSESMSDLDLMKAMLAAMDPAFDADNQSEDYIRGVFAANVKALAKGAKPAAESNEAETMSQGDSPEAYPKPGDTPPAKGTDEDLALDSFNALRRGAPPRQAKQDAADAGETADAARRRMLEHNRNLGRAPLSPRK